jgi:hypothetical protein
MSRAAWLELGMAKAAFMHKTLKITAGLSALTLAVLLPQLTATAAPITTSLNKTVRSASTLPDPPVYSPKAGVVFNDPTGTNAQRYVIANQVNSAIDATPAKAIIRIATYSMNYESTVDKLIAADQRGVSVRFLIDNHITTPQTTRLTKALGTNMKSRSFVRTCKGSCMSSSPSIMHAKLYLFSTAGTSKLVSMVGSANQASSSAASWNNMNTTVGNATVYNSVAKYFDDMIKDKNDPGYYRTTTSGTNKLYYYPRNSSTTDLVAELNKVKCTGVAAGYGNKGRTVVRAEMYNWSVGRKDLADKLYALRSQGCDVQVITNVPLTGSGVMKSLLRNNSKYGIMPVYNAMYDNNKDGISELYMHNKVLTISGNWNGNARSKVVYTGSQNFTVNSTRNNNEILYRIDSDAAYDAYLVNLNNVRAAHANLVRSASARSLGEGSNPKITAVE